MDRSWVWSSVTGSAIGCKTVSRVGGLPPIKRPHAGYRCQAFRFRHTKFAFGSRDFALACCYQFSWGLVLDGAPPALISPPNGRQGNSGVAQSYWQGSPPFFARQNFHLCTFSFCARLSSMSIPNDLSSSPAPRSSCRVLAGKMNLLVEALYIVGIAISTSALSSGPSMRYFHCKE